MTDGWRSLKFILSTHELARDLDQGAVKMGHSRLFSPSLCASRRARSPGVESTLRAEIRTPPPPPQPPLPLSSLLLCPVHPRWSAAHAASTPCVCTRLSNYTRDAMVKKSNTRTQLVLRPGQTPSPRVYSPRIPHVCAPCGLIYRTVGHAARSESLTALRSLTRRPPLAAHRRRRRAPGRSR